MEFEEIFAKNVELMMKSIESHIKGIKAFKVFDFAKAEKIITDRGAVKAEAGLIEDWFWTAATIFENGEKLNGAFLCSHWATPVLCLDDDLKNIECWKEIPAEDFPTGKEAEKYNEWPEV